MHEFGLCESIMEAVERRAKGRPVSGVRVQVGALHRVDEASLVSAFALVAEGTVAADAQMEFVELPVRLRCRTCGQESASPDLLGYCPRCQAPDPELLGGDELLLESITVAEPA